MRRLLALALVLSTLSVPLAAPAYAAGPTTWTEAGGYPVLQHPASTDSGGAGYWCSGNPMLVTVGFGTDLAWVTSDFPDASYDWVARAPLDPPSANPETRSPAEPMRGGAQVDGFNVTYTLPAGWTSHVYTMSLAVYMFPAGAPYDTMRTASSVLIIDCSNKEVLRNFMEMAMAAGIDLYWDDDLDRPARVRLRLPRLPRSRTRYAVTWGDRASITLIDVGPQYQWRETGTWSPTWDSERECMDALTAVYGGGGGFSCEEFFEGEVFEEVIDHDYPNIAGQVDPVTGEIYHPYSVYVWHDHPVDQPYIVGSAQLTIAHRC